jgi:hypothetical protein
MTSFPFTLKPKKIHKAGSQGMFELDMLHIPGFIVFTSSHEAVTTPNKLTVKSQDNSGQLAPVSLAYI